MDANERRALIDRYREGADVVERALAAVGSDALDRRPAPDEWTPREVVHHLADSEMTSAIRLRRLIAEDDPAIQGYDEVRFAQTLHYDRPIEGSLAALRGARDASVSLLERLTDAEWSRAGTHSEVGTYSVEIWLRIYAEHCHDHAEQIRRAGGALA